MGSCLSKYRVSLSLCIEWIELHAVLYVQGGSGGKVNIWGGDSIGNCEEKFV